MQVWFNATQAKCEVLFKVKLALYEEACLSLAANSFPGNEVMNAEEEKVSRMPQLLLVENMSLMKPLKTSKTSHFIDAIEQRMHRTFDALENGYTLNEDDKRAFEHARFSTRTNDAAIACGSHPDPNENPQLYGELTSKGVRQLHHIVLRCLGRVGAVTHLGETGKEKNEAEEERETEDTEGARESCPRRFHSVVAVDIGSGTGKLLFEWSLLARRDAPRCGWTHVGLELAPSRMRVARCAMRTSASLVCPSARGRWRVDTPCRDEGGKEGAEEEEVRIVLGEADVFSSGLLSNETFFSIAGDVMAGRDASLGNQKGGGQHNGDDDSGVCLSCHLVVFCCGLGFAESAVRELCSALERMWLTSYTSSSLSWRTLTCVFLLRAFVELRSFPLFRLCSETAGHGDATASQFYAVKLNTTWMNEAPAWVLSLRRV